MSNTIDYDPNFQHHRELFVVGTKAVLKNGAGEILLLLRSEKVGQGGKWGMPGGSLELNEQPLSCIQREIAEEIQLTIPDLELFTTHASVNAEGENTVIVGYRGSVKADQKIVINWEHDEYQWITREAALLLPNLTLTTRIFLEQDL